ncbi:MAG: hypothetical protein R6W89_00560 [Candidatus Hydrogenedentota bacterium]
MRFHCTPLTVPRKALTPDQITLVFFLDVARSVLDSVARQKGF